MDIVRKIFATELNKERYEDTKNMNLVSPTYMTIVSGLAYHSNQEICKYLVKRNAGIDKLYYTEGAVLDPKSKFEIIDLDTFKKKAQGTPNLHFLGLSLLSNVLPLCAATAAVTSDSLCDFKWSCCEGDKEEEVLRRIKKEVSLAFDAVGSGPTPEVIEHSFSAPLRAPLYTAILAGALAL
jgi:hypothetical protein